MSFLKGNKLSFVKILPSAASLEHWLSRGGPKWSVPGVESEIEEGREDSGTQAQPREATKGIFDPSRYFSSQHFFYADKICIKYAVAGLER